MAPTISSGRLRRLSELQPERGRVLSIFFDLDPDTFGAPPARETELNSVTDEAGKLIDSLDDLEHDEKVALRDDVDRVREALTPFVTDTGGARGVAVYACGLAGLLEVVRLPHPIERGVFLDRSPYIAPLAIGGDGERWLVVLASRKAGRILHGSEDGLQEAERVDDDVHGQHQQGGWSQARYQRSVDQEKGEHLDRLAEEVFRQLRRRPFDRLLIAAPEPLDHELEAKLHPYVKEKLVGRVQVDVESSTPDDVLAAAAPVIDGFRTQREEEAVGRLKEGLARGARAAAGREDVRMALAQGQVETLILDGRAEHDDELIEQALGQSAEILVLRDRPDLEPHEGVAAILRW